MGETLKALLKNNKSSPKNTDCVSNKKKANDEDKSQITAPGKVKSLLQSFSKWHTKKELHYASENPNTQTLSRSQGLRNRKGFL